MSKITEYAEGRDCTARIPGYCRNDTPTSVWCHLNSIRWGSGRGRKAPDACGLIADHVCHGIIDGSIKTDYTRDQIKMFAYEGHMESLAMLIKDGILK